MRTHRSGPAFLLAGALAATALLGAPVAQAHAVAPAAGLAEVSTTLIIDSSGSMLDNDPDDLRKDGAVAYLTASQSTDEVGVVDFDDSARVLSDPVEVGANRDALVDFIGQIDSAGGTDLGLGLQTGCTSLSNASGVERAAIFLTDGDGDYNGEADCFVQRGWPVYTIGLGSFVDETLLQEIATSTNGRYLALSDATNLVCEFQQIRAEIGGQASGGCAPNGTVTQGQTVTQTLTVAPSTAQTTVTLSYASSPPTTTNRASARGRSARAAADGTELALSLISPSNITYERLTVRPDLVVSSGDTYESFTVTNPAAGAWTVNVKGVSVPSGSAPFNISSVQLTGAAPPPPPPPAAITNSTPPRLSTTPRVGGLVSVDSGTYNVSGLSFGYQWFLGGSPIAGATSSEYRPTAADAGKLLRATVTASKPGYASISTSSDAASVAPLARLAATSPPRVTGTAAPGGTLVAHPGTWSLSGAEFYYRWRRDGVVIRNSAGRSYVVGRRDIGHRLFVEVAAVVDGQDPVAARSAAVAVPKVVPAMTARLKKATIAEGKRGRVVVMVRSARVQPRGRVTVKEGSTTLGSASLARNAVGGATITLRRLPAGVHTLTVIYGGSEQLARSTRRVVLTVRGG